MLYEYECKECNGKTETDRETTRCGFCGAKTTLVGKIGSIGVWVKPDELDVDDLLAPMDELKAEVEDCVKRR